MTDMTKRRAELADKRSKRQCSAGNPDLDRAISWYLRIGFEDGWDARGAIANEQLKAKNAVIDLALNELVELKEFTASILEDMNHYFDNKCIPTLNEVNQCAIAYNQVEKTLEQIQKMRGGDE